METGRPIVRLGTGRKRGKARSALVEAAARRRDRARTTAVTTWLGSLTGVPRRGS